MKDTRPPRGPISTILSLFALLLPLAGAASPWLPPLDHEGRGERLPGKFTWFDLATAGLDEQKAFYGRVFDWRFRTFDDMDDRYTLIDNGGRPIGGMFVAPGPAAAEGGAVWIGLISVTDVDRAVADLEASGGGVHLRPATLPGRGTYALVRDPEGALFGLLASDGGDPPDREIPVGAFFWTDLFVSRPDDAVAFYAGLVGYDVDREGVGEQVERRVLRAGGEPRAGIVPLPEGANRAGWLPYVRVTDIGETLRRVEAAGGQVMVEPHPDLLDGNLAIFADPEGGMLGIVKWEGSRPGESES